MNEKQQLLQLLGLARRAGKIVSGEAFVLAQLKSHKIKLVFLASDTAQKTADKIKAKCCSYQVEVIDLFDRQKLSAATNLARSAIGITDEGFARKVLQVLKKLVETKR